MSIGAAASSFAARPGLRQFAKFCIVGASSTILDFTVFNLALRAGLSPAKALTCSFLVAVTNGFIWNSRWTFRATRGDARKQYPKFVATNIVGWMLSLFVVTTALVLAAHLRLTTVHHTPLETMRIVLFGAHSGERSFSFLALNAAKVCATIVGVVWNFTASKFWTFKQHPAPAPASSLSSLS